MVSIRSVAIAILDSRRRTSTEKRCAGSLDCGPDACRNGNCVDKVNGNAFDCDEDYELMLQVNDSVCVVKECSGTRVMRHTRWQLVWEETD